MIKIKQVLCSGFAMGAGFVLSACVHPPVTSSSAIQSTTPIENAEVAPDVVTLSFARGPCLKRCEAYRIEWSTSGEYRVNGESAPATMPTRINAETNRELLSLYRQVNELGLPEKLSGTTVCPRFMTDMPTLSLSWHSANLHWQLKHNLGCRAFTGEARLLALESRIEALLPKIPTHTEQ